MAQALLGSVGAGAEVVLAAVLLFLAVRGYARARSPRIALVALAFALLLAQGLVLAAGLLTAWLTVETATALAPMLGAGALLCMYAGGLRP